MTVKKYKHFVLCFIFLYFLNFCSVDQRQEEYITIGALLPLTGESSDEGLRAVSGLMLAKDEINNQGGILGKKLDIIVLNDRGNEGYVVKQYNALIERGVIAIIGSSYSNVTTALAIASEKDGIPVISPTASDPNVTKGRKNIFRAIFIDDYQAKVMAHFALHYLHAKTAVVLSNQRSDNLAHIAGVFADSFTAQNGQIAAVESFYSEDDFKPILEKYAKNPPDLFFCPEDFVPAAKLVNAVYQAGFTGTYILGSDAWDGLLTYIHHPAAMDNVYYSAPFSFDDKSDNVVLFVRNYFNAFSQMPLSGSATAYTCMYILAEAIKTAGNTDKNDIISAIKSNSLEMITGRIKFDENNNPHTNVFIVQLKGGTYSTFAKISL